MPRKISTILHDAADIYYRPGQFSCNTIALAITKGQCCVFTRLASSQLGYAKYGTPSQKRMAQRIKIGLENMGLETHSSNQFDDFGDGDSDERFAARYNWLKFAALIAEEQGV